ncbi:hypothetical protein cypCar_00022362 [Cyprinus carpio]|nr:hypothetical protein cypCar_00022362 [Cyprinus carpio]
MGVFWKGWIWTRESQSQIQDVKNKYASDMAAITRDLELKYRETLTENRRTAAHLEVELEKERQREEKNRLLQSGVAGVVLRKALQREEDWQRRAQALLQELEVKLVERQEAFCSILLPREHRLEMEKNLLLKVAKDPGVAELNLEEDLRDIFKNDRHCADLLNLDKRKNGKLMWLYLRYWQLQVTLQKHKRAEETLKGALLNSSRP